MPNVYVVQEPLKIDRLSGRAVPRFPLAKAGRYGNIRIVLDWSDCEHMMTEELIAKLCFKMKNFGKEDYLLLCGNPTMIGLAVKIALDRVPFLKVLEWDHSIPGYDLRTVPSFMP